MERPIAIKGEPFAVKASEEDIRSLDRETSDISVSRMTDLDYINEELKLLGDKLRKAPRPSSADRIAAYKTMGDKYHKVSEKYSINWKADAKSEAEKLARIDAMEQQFSNLLARRHALNLEINALESAAKGLKDGIKVAPTAEILPLIPLYKLKKKEIPAEIQLFDKYYDFYWVRFVLKLFYPKGWKIDELNPIKVEFNSDESIAAKRPVAWDIVPSTKFREYIKFDGTAGIDLDLRINIPLDPKTGLPIPKIGDIKAEVKTNLLILWEYSYKKASILSSGKQDFEPEWRITSGDSFELLNSGDLALNVILKKLDALESVNANVSFKGSMSHRPFPYIRRKPVPISGSTEIKLLPLPKSS